METTFEKTWAGPIPACCEMCSAPIQNVFIDGKVEVEPSVTGWAIMCEQCHGEVGIGLGIGHGQRYEKQGDEFVLARGEQLP